MDSSEQAANRVSYQLCVKRSPEKRDFSAPGLLTGPDIDCAYVPGNMSRGGWSEPTEHDLSEQEWLDHFQLMALQECVHEALEWFRVDGKPWLDPHVIQNKIDVHDAVVRLWTKLKEIKYDES